MTGDFVWKHDVDIALLQEVACSHIATIRGYTKCINIGKERCGTAIIVKDGLTLPNVRRLLSGRGTAGTFNRLKPNDPYMSRTAPLTFKRCILYIYSINIGSEYFKHALYSPFFSLQNAVCFIMLTSLVPVLFTYYIQVC